MFSINSRYYNIATATLESPGGKKINYVRRRFLPPVENFALLMEHTVIEGDRLDNVTANYIGDPEQFWRLCDANGVMCPEQLTATVGGKIRITLPEGIPGTPNA